MAEMIVWVSGPTGAGKSTIARGLERIGHALVPESVPSDLVAAFSRSPTQYGEPLQRAIMLSRRDSWHLVRRERSIVFDRSVSEDVEVFCRLHYLSGRITEEQLLSLQRFAESIQTAMPEPDLILYVAASPAVLRARC